MRTMLLAAVPPSRPLTAPVCTAAQRAQGQWISAYLQGRGKTLTVRLIRNYRCARPFSVNASRFVLQLQSVDVPSRVRLLQPVETGTLTLRPIHTGFMSWITGTRAIDLDFQVPPDVPADMYHALALSNSGTYDPITRFSPPLLPGMFPSSVYVPSGASGDPGLTQARSVFLNSVVYPRSGIGVQCEAAGATQIFPNIPSDQPLRIINISRSTAPGEIWTLGGAFKNTLDNTALFLSLDPLVVEFAGGNLRSAGGGGTTPSATFSVLENMQKCGSMRLTVSDPWELQRIVSFGHPYDRPDWPTAFRKAIQEGKVLAGMTHEMVASALGYPSAYAPIPQLDRLARWDYVRSAPFSSTVFFASDRVVRYDPPGQLP